MGFYKNTGATKEIKAQIFAAKIIEHYKEDSSELRLKQRRFKSCAIDKYALVTPLYISKSQRPGQDGQRITNPFRLGDEKLKAYITDVLAEGFYIKYKDNLKNRWHCYSIRFDTTTKK